MARRLAVVAVGFVLSWGCGGKKTTPAPGEGAGKQAEYAAAGSCAECHAAQAKTHAETGMGRAFARATEASAGREFAGAGVFHHKASDRYYQPVRREGRFFVRRWQKDESGAETNAIEYEVHYVVGSGNHSKTFLHRDGANHLIEMPVSWYADGGGKWAMSPGYDNPAHYDFRRKIHYDCFFCHNGYPRWGVEAKDAGTTGAGAEPVYPGELPEGIDCQRCHGPGAAHVAAAKRKAGAEELRKLIVHPGRLPAERRMEVCLQCHLETTSFPLPNAIQRYGRGAFSYRPGEPLKDYMLHFDHARGAGREEKFEIAGAAYRLRQSQCFVKSGGKLQCTTCHDPHRARRGAEAVSAYAAVCRGCHETELKKLVAAGRHTGKQECAGCHMPKRRTEDVVHVVMTDHKIARRAPAGSLLAARAERLETAGVTYRGEVAPYYPAGEAATAEEELYRAVAQVLQKSNLEAGIARLAAALRKHAPMGPAFYFDLAEAYLAAGKRGEAMAWYEAALKQDAAFAPAMRGLGGALLQQNDLGRAIPLLEKARGLDGRDAPTLQALGRAYQQQGRMTEAVAALRAAVALEPVDAGIRELLANALAAAGDAAGAEAEFRAAILHQPDLATAHYGYAATLAARGQFDQAEPAMRRAVALGPGLAQPREMLGNLYARTKRWALAREQYREALKIDPRFGRAHLGMAMVMGSMGDFAAAKRHLQEAAASGDAAVAQDARELLGSLP